VPATLPLAVDATTEAPRIDGSLGLHSVSEGRALWNSNANHPSAEALAANTANTAQAPAAAPAAQQAQQAQALAQLITGTA